VTGQISKNACFCNAGDATAATAMCVMCGVGKYFSDLTNSVRFCTDCPANSATNGGGKGAFSDSREQDDSSDSTVFAMLVMIKTQITLLLVRHIVFNPRITAGKRHRL